MAQPKSPSELTTLAATLDASADFVVEQGNVVRKVSPTRIITEAATFTQSGSGAITGTVQGELRSRAINAVTQFGLSTTGTASANYTALSNAIAAAVGRGLYIPGGTYSIDPTGGALTLACHMFGDGANASILSVAGNGDIFNRSGYSVLSDLTINMNGASFSGHACQFAASTPKCVDRNVEIKNVADTKQALLFAADGGSQFFSSGSLYHTLSAVGTNAAIKFGTDTAARPRTFVGTESAGCTLFDFGACNDAFVFGGFTNGLIFSSDNAARVLLSSIRVGTQGADVVIKGDNHKIKGCVFADPVELATGSSNIDFDSEVNNYDITDNGTSNSLVIPLLSYTPTWTASVSNPAIGDGTIVGTFSVNGRLVTADIRITMGSTTTFGSGVWRFGLPFTAATAAGNVWNGSSVMLDATTIFRIGVSQVSSGAAFAEVMPDSSTTTGVSPTVPFTWVQNDRIDIKIIYPKA